MKTLLESLNKQALNETVDKEIDLYLSSDDSDDPDTITIDLTKIKNPMKNFGEITFSYEPHGGFYFKGKSNLNSLAVQQTANKKSNDNIASSVKTTNLDSSSLSRISNLWG
jgi:hypothetical protein